VFEYVGVTEGVTLSEAELVGVIVLVAEFVAVIDTVAELEPETVTVAELLVVTVTVAVDVGEPEADGVVVLLSVDVGVTDSVGADGVPVAVADVVGVAVKDVPFDGEGEKVGVEEAVILPVAVTVGEEVLEPVPLTLAVEVAVAVEEGVPETEVVTVAVPEAELVTVAVPDAELVTEAVPELDGEEDSVGADGVPVAVVVPVGVGVREVPFEGEVEKVGV